MTMIRDTLSPANRLNRQQRREEFWQGRKKKFFLAIVLLSFLLQLLFLGNMSYLYGSIWKSTERYSALEVLYIDYDEGIVGQCVNAAYQQLKGPGFPTFIQRNRSQYPSSDDVVNAVKDTSYWAAFTTTLKASDRLALALQGGKAAQDYDPSDALSYVWNEVRYPPFVDEAIEGNFEALVATTRLAYNALNGTHAFSSMNTDDPAALQVLLNPITASSVNIMPTKQQTKLFYNTVSMVMPILQQFFFLLILNGISQELQVYSKLPLYISGFVRAGLSVTFDCVAALCMSGYIWAFRETWDVSANQFVLTWMVLWLLMHVHFLVMDIGTAFLPLPALPFFVLTWIIINITSSISPLPVNPGFYKWGYALPTNEAYTVLTDIWSSGSVPQLYRAMPILFSWWIVGIGAATYAHIYRCHKAWKQHEKIEELAKSNAQGSQHSASEGVLQALGRTPSQTLIEAAQLYRSVYGPSVPPPMGLWRTFVINQPGTANQRDDTNNADGSREGETRN